MKYRYHFLIFVFSFLILTSFRIVPDLGWHLAIGNRFLEQGEVIYRDPFTWTLPGYEWGNSYFLYQILVAFLFKNIGYLGSVFFFGGVVSLAILMMLPKKINLWTFLIVGLAQVTALANVGIRPHNLDWPFFSLLLIFLYKKSYRQKAFIPVWFVFFALWANIHVGFVFGLVIFAAILTLDFIGSAVEAKRSKLKIYLAATLAAFAGTFFTPFHFLMWKSIFFDSAGVTGFKSIDALQSTAIFAPYNFFLATTCVIFIYMLRSKAKKIDTSWLLMACFVFLLGFFVVDFLYIWAIVFVFLGTRFFDIKYNPKGRLEQMAIFLVAFVAFLVLGLNFVVNLLQSRTLEERLLKDQYPKEAVNFLVKNNLVKNLFNEYSWGGYIDWQAPQLKVFIDGRLAGWRKPDGRPILSDYVDILKGRCEVIKDYDIRVALVKGDFENGCFFGFRKVYEDSVSKVLVRYN